MPLLLSDKELTMDSSQKALIDRREALSLLCASTGTALFAGSASAATDWDSGQHIGSGYKGKYYVSVFNREQENDGRFVVVPDTIKSDWQYFYLYQITKYIHIESNVPRTVYLGRYGRFKIYPKGGRIGQPGRYFFGNCDHSVNSGSIIFGWNDNFNLAYQPKIANATFAVNRLSMTFEYTVRGVTYTKNYTWQYAGIRSATLL